MFSAVSVNYFPYVLLTAIKSSSLDFFFTFRVVKPPLHVLSSYFIQLVKGRSGIARIYSRTSHAARRALCASVN